MKFPAHPQSTCITWQHKPQSSWTPGCHRVPQKSSCLGMGKPPRWVPWRSSKPQELGALGRRTWKVWGSTRLGGGGCRAASLLHRQKREMVMLRQDEKQHLFLSKAGGVDFIHLKRKVCPLCYQSLHPWREHPGDLPSGDSDTLLGSLRVSVELLHPRTASLPHQSGAFQLSTAPSEKFGRALLCSALASPVTTKICKSFTSIKNVKQDQHFSHQMSNTSEADSTRSLWEFLSSIIYCYKLLTRSSLFRPLCLLHQQKKRKALILQVFLSAHLFFLRCTLAHFH